MKKLQKHWRQGDVLIEAIDQVPKSAKAQKASNKVILAHGEVTGHHHALEVADPADWWKGEQEIAPTNDKPKTLAGEVFLRLKDGGAVTHQEHSRIELPAGTYRVTRQREYHPEEIRNVQD